jgi:hypothetical protein
MAGIVQPIEVIYKGESKTLRFTVTDRSGNRVSLSTATAIEWQMNYPVGPPYSAAVAKSLGSGIALDNQSDPATMGDLLVTISPNDTKDLVAKRYKHDLWVTIGGHRKCAVRPSDVTLAEPVNGV